MGQKDISKALLAGDTNDAYLQLARWGLPWVNWRSLRTSHATWPNMAGADGKDAQAQMRPSRSSTTLDIYQQFIPECQPRAVDKTQQFAELNCDQVAGRKACK